MQASKVTEPGLLQRRKAALSPFFAECCTMQECRLLPRGSKYLMWFCVGYSKFLADRLFAAER